MGIDIYTRWEGQTEEEKRAQICGFDITVGGVGYLREAYHGEPYATRYLVREAFEGPTATAQIRASVLRERLPRTIELALEREREVYGNRKVTRDDPCIRSFIEFVELVEKKERETGKLVNIVASY